jgi:hypothetical protein
MPAGPTYEPIATTTLSTATASVTFSSISGSYTDLVVVVAGTKSGTGSSDISWQANGNTGSNYSQTALYGDGSSAASDRGSNATSARAGRVGASQSVSILNFQNYSNATTHKTCIARGNAGSNLVITQVGLFRNTSAITSLSFALATADNFASGCVFTLYGIKAA